MSRCKHKVSVWIVKPVPNIVGYVPQGWQWCSRCGATRMVEGITKANDGSEVLILREGPLGKWRSPKEPR